MSKLLTRILFGLLFLLFALSFYQTAKADIALPEYVFARCSSDEILVECDTGQHMNPLQVQKSAIQQLFAVDTCKQYENNPRARFMAGSKGSVRYCYKELSLAGISIYHLRNLVTLIFATIIFELAIFYLFGFRSKKAWLAIILVNILSVSLFYFTNIFFLPAFFLPASPVITLTGELIVILFELTILRIILTEFSFLRIFISTLIANITSATAGSLILLLVKSYFKA